MRANLAYNVSGAAVIVIALVAAPFVLPGDYYLGVLALGLIYAIWVTSWDFMSGLTGRVNFGQGLFFGAGAYLAAYLSTRLGASMWLSFPFGAALAAVMAVLIGYPTLRLRGPYFALATFSALIVVRRVTLNLWEYTGAEEGMSGLPPLFGSRLHSYFFVLAVALSTVGVLLLLAHTRLGMILRAIGGDEAACSAAGINVDYYKILSLVISCALGAVGGVLYAHYQQHVGPELFSMSLGLMIITMAYVGGNGTIYGGAIAAILLSFLTELLRPFGEWRLAVYSVVLVVVIFLLPNGVVAPTWQRLKALMFGRISGRHAQTLQASREQSS